MAGLLESAFRWAHPWKVKAFEGIPGPSPRFPFGSASDFLGRPQPWEVCAEYGRRYGGMVLVWVFGKPFVVLNDPALIGEVLDAKNGSYYKDAPVAALLPVITRFCLFISNGADWARRRALHPFSAPWFGEWLGAQAPAFRAALEAKVEHSIAACAAGPIDLLPAIQRLSFDVFARVVFGEELTGDDYERFLHLGRVGHRRMRYPFPFLALPYGPHFYRDRRLWYDKFSRLIEAAARGPAPERTDLLAELVRRGVPVGGEEFRALLANVFYGGVFSVTSCLVTTLYLLDRHPEIAATLRAEVGELFARSPPFDGAALGASPYLDGVVRESLRYLTPVPIFPRNVQTTGPVELGGHVLPANTILLITNWALHRSPAHWKEPDRYDPSRWAGGEAAANPMGSGYFFPFGRGPRACVGMPFALCYLKIALATFLVRARWEMPPGQDYRQSFFFGVMMPQGLRARALRPL